MIDCKSTHSKCEAHCCSVVPMHRSMLDKHKTAINRPIVLQVPVPDLLDYVVPVTEDYRCCFLRDDLSCGIYEDRPDVCRRFGDESTLLLKCSWCRKDGTNRPRQERRLLRRQVLKQSEKQVKRSDIVINSVN